MNNTDKILIKADNLSKELPSYGQEWYFNLRAGGKTPATCYDYICKLKQFLASIDSDIKNIGIDKLTYATIAKYFISIQTKIDSNGNKIETSGSFQRSNWYALNNLFDFLTKRNYIDSNPMNLINKTKKRDIDRINEHRVLLTESDFKSIIDVVKNNDSMHYAKWRNEFASRDTAIIMLFMTTGMRNSALTNIDINDIDFSNHTLKVVDKGNKFHMYNITEEVEYYLNDWLSHRKTMAVSNTNALFISRYGDRMVPDAIINMVNNYTYAALGKKLSPHKFRAGFVSILYSKTGNIEFCRRSVGHSNVATTQRYIVTNNNERVKASNMISNVLK